MLDFSISTLDLRYTVIKAVETIHFILSEIQYMFVFAFNYYS